MAALERAPVWVNLEHLSAEPWVDGCHGLPSPHPTLQLEKYFFFPGFTDATGGLLIERTLPPARKAFQADANARSQFWGELGLRADDATVRVSLFCYDNAGLESLVGAWSEGNDRILCVAPPGAAVDRLAATGGRRLSRESASSAGR